MPWLKIYFPYITIALLYQAACFTVALGILSESIGILVLAYRSALHVLLLYFLAFYIKCARSAPWQMTVSGSNVLLGQKC